MLSIKIKSVSAFMLLVFVAASAMGCNKNDNRGPQTLEQQRAALHTEVITSDKLNQYMSQHPNMKIKKPDQQAIPHPTGH